MAAVRVAAERVEEVEEAAVREAVLLVVGILGEMAEQAALPGRPLA